MWRYELQALGLDHLLVVTGDLPAPGSGEVRVKIEAVSLNYRDLMIVKGLYNPRLKTPCTPLSDAAGVVTAVGEGVCDIAVGDRVMTHFIAGWQDGPYRGEYALTTLGTPGPGVAAEEVLLPAAAVVAMGDRLDFEQAATLPIAAVTAWNALVTEGDLRAGQTLVSLGTGGVSIFAVQIGKALGARVIVTSSSDEKIARARQLGADHGVNYRQREDWAAQVLEITEGRGADLVVENGGAGTLTQSLRATRPGGTIAMLGALTGLRSEIDIAPVLMKRLRVQGIFVGSRGSFGEMVKFMGEHGIEPVIDARYPMADLVPALEWMAQGGHFGKIVLHA